MDLSSHRFINPRILEPLCVVALASVFFFVRFGIKVLDPGQIDWLMTRDDPAAYFLIWDFFRHESWSFPLGQVTAYLHPLGTSLPLADGLPILAYPAKLLSPLLPGVFQYFGFWHLLCAVLQAWFGYRIVRRFLPDSLGRILGSLLFLLAPVYIYREGHIALSSHWVLLAAIDLYLLGFAGGWKRTTGRWALLLAVTSLIHPYLVAMVLLVFAGLVLHRNQEVIWSWLPRMGIAAVVGVTIILVWWVAGNLSGLTGERVRATGFGHYSLNLNGFFNPTNCGTMLPQLPRGPGQYEGIAYLGVGWLLIAVAGLVFLALKRDLGPRLRPHLGLFWVMVATYMYALSNVVMWNETVVLQYIRMPVLDIPADVFRCSGRFVWPVIYAGMTGLMALLGRIRYRKSLAAFLALALFLQVRDIHPLVFQAANFAKLEFQTRLVDSNWDKAAQSATGLTTFPPFRFSLINKGDYRDICWLASRHRIFSSAGYAARMSQAARALADSMRTAIAEGQADTTQLYICDRQSFPSTMGHLGDHFRGSIWDDYYVCYPRSWALEPRLDFTAPPPPSLSEFLADRQDMTLILAVRDEATDHLTPEDKQILREVGFDVDALAYRGSAIAVLDKGHVVWQELSPDRKLELAIKPGDSFSTFEAKRSIDVVSAGFLVGNTASLRLDGREQGFDGRGMNFLVLGPDQELQEIACFDTHKGRPGMILIPTAEME